MRKKVFFCILIVTLMLSVFGIASAQDSEIATVTFVASDEGIEVPAEVSAGLVTFNFENNRSDAGWTPNVFRLNDDATMDDLMAAASGDNPLEAVFLLTMYGGVGVGPGEAASYTTALIPGQYILAESDGDSFDPFTVVEGDMMDATAPDADIELVMVDFAFGIPAFIPSGELLWHLDNAGDQWHEMVIIAAPEGIESVADVRAAIASGMPAPEPSFYWGAMGAGVEAWVDISLEPGTYVLICFLPDIAGDFTPHMDMGMIQVFTVE